MFWGSILMTITGIAFWYPPVPGESNANFAYGAVVLCLHWLFFTVCMVPLNSLGPEIARSRQARMKLGTYFSAGLMFGITVSAILPGLMVDVLDPARHADPPAFSAVGYQRTAIILALFALFLVQVPTWVLRERHRPVQAEAEARMPLFDQLLAALTNRVFLLWIASTICFNTGYLATQKLLPYWVGAVLGGDETMVAMMMGPFVVAAFLALPVMLLLSKRVPSKWLWFSAMALITLVMPGMYVIAVLPCSVLAKTVLAISAFCLVGIGQGALFVLYTPLMGEIIDLDEQRTGHRREGIYCGLSGIAWKSGQALSAYVLTIPMDRWGNSEESPLGILLVGPIAAIFGVAALAIVWFYPVLQDGGKGTEPDAPGPD